jgi:hypothetical protein
MFPSISGLASRVVLQTKKASIMQRTNQLDYAANSGDRGRGGVILPLALLVFVGGIIWALRELAVMPYRPPNDMSTMLGGPEEELVWTLIAILAVIWVGILIWCMIRFRHARSGV